MEQSAVMHNFSLIRMSDDEFDLFIPYTKDLQKQTNHLKKRRESLMKEKRDLDFMAPTASGKKS